jgi:hypothetical protein
MVHRHPISLNINVAMFPDQMLFEELTEIKAVRSMDIRGIISTNCSDATSSSSAGVIETCNEEGSAIVSEPEQVH